MTIKKYYSIKFQVEKDRLKLILIIVLFTNCLMQLPVVTYSQGIAINTTGTEADPSSMLDVSSTDKGVLIPRMSTVQRNAVSSPAQGLIIYNTTTKCFEFYDNSSWYSLGCICTMPDIPIATAGTGATSTQITANWNAATGATSYSLDVSTVSDFSSFVAGYNDLNVGAVTTYDVTGLDCNTTYYYRVRAVNACGTTGSSNTITYATSVTCPACGATTTVTDIDGNVYNTVSIGTQCWMKESLKTTKYKNSTAIPNVTVNATWAGLASGAYCCYNNDCPTYDATYGKLYNWYAVNNANGLCPAGWHVPTHDEWTTLEIAICTSGSCAADFPYNTTTVGFRGTNEGDKLKESGTVHWASGNTGTNTSGFTALPGAMRTNGGTFVNITLTGHFWTATPKGTSAWARYVRWDYSTINRSDDGKTFGYSMRCVKD